MANYNAYTMGASNDEYKQWHGAASGQAGNSFGLGYSNVDPAVTYYDGAARFENIQINQGVSVNAAQLRLYAQFQGTTGNVKFKTYGIKETNTAAFTSNPFSRTKTSAVTTSSQGLPGVGAFIGVDVTSQVNEILGQGGWASGNAMGFLCFDNTSDVTANIEDDSQKCQLLIQVSGTSTFTPTPGTISAPTFPTSQDWGLKISQPGVDVKTATESQLYFTSRKKELRVGTELSTNGGTSQYAHGLGYAPSVLGYYNSSGTTRIMNVPSNVFSVEEYIASDGTNVNYFLNGTAETGYLYVFIDPLT